MNDLTKNILVFVVIIVVPAACESANASAAAGCPGNLSFSSSQERRPQHFAVVGPRYSPFEEGDDLVGKVAGQIQIDLRGAAVIAAAATP